jgi:ankyrin repeat protein
VPPADGAPRAPPSRPSAEHLRKQAKRLAKSRGLQLAEAQRAIAAEYGAANWAELMRSVEAARGPTAVPQPDPLAAAARDGDVAAVRRLLGEGHPADGAPGAGGQPLWQACSSNAPVEARLAIVGLLLDAGANPRHDGPGETALHAAARHGPLALVELLIRGKALEWQPDRHGRPAIEAARRGQAADKAAIVALLDRPVIDDPAFRAAVTAIHGGDAEGLARLLDAEPRLLRERAVEPQCYRDAGRHQYFMDPKLFWFVANNPAVIKRMPDNIVAVARTMIERGVERADLDYTLELVMTSSPASEQGLQFPLMELLVEAGAEPTVNAIDVTLGHRERAPIEALIGKGLPLTASIAAGTGRIDRLASLLRSAATAEIQKALGMAVINGEREAVRMTLDAGADPNQVLPVHRHSVPLHQAAIDEDLELMALLVARGARTDIRDTLWGATPLDWARHQKKGKAEAWLMAHQAT